jgi:hypothetical protein
MYITKMFYLEYTARIRTPFGTRHNGTVKLRGFLRYVKLCYVALVLMSTSGGCLHAEVAEFQIDEKPLQEIKGWGVTPAPIDWDGKSTLRAKALMQKVLGDLGETIVRLTLGNGGLYWEEHGGINEERVRSVLFQQVAVLEECHIQQYMLSITVPPSVMRRYRSDESHINLDPNPLRAEYEVAFGNYVACVVSLLKKDNLKLPIALSFQSQPDIPPGPYFGSASAPGCPFTPSDWSRVAGIVRNSLDNAGLATVGLVGPEARSTTWINAALESILGTRGDTLAGVFIVRPRSGIEDNERISLLSKIDRIGKDVWISAECGGVTNDRELLLSVFSQLCGDMVELRPNYWFWQYAFTWDRSPLALRYGGQLSVTPLSIGLSKLWRGASLGSVVHRLTSTSSNSVLPGVAFVNGSHCFVVIVNVDGTKKDAILKAKLSGAEGSMISELNKVAELAYLPDGSGVSFTIPPRSIFMCAGGL